MVDTLNMLAPFVFAAGGIAAIGTIAITAIPNRQRILRLAAQGFGL
jgi:hypothetical protein